MRSEKREEHPERPQSKEAYLEAFQKEWEQIHEGEPPVLGLKFDDRTKRKDMCEDVKLSNREKGLYLVADGVSTANGWFASREASRIMYEHLGEHLDRAIENNVQEALRAGENPVERITNYVGTQMVAAVAQADSRIQAMGAMNTEFQESGTTLSLAKLVDIPLGNGESIQRLFFTNVGDSRIYIQQKGQQELWQVTRDDSVLESRLERGKITEVEVRAIDQAPDYSRLHPTLQEYAKHRNIVTKAVGDGSAADKLSVSYLDLQPGDRLVIVSDGVSDQMLTNRIAETIRGITDDRQAERNLQDTAFGISEANTEPRSKGDDISALVKTIEGRGPDRSYLSSEHRPTQETKVLPETVRDLRLRHKEAADAVVQIENGLAQLRSDTLLRDRLSLLQQLEKAKQVEASYRYHVQRVQLELYEQQVPPRFHTGEQVQMWREDFDPPSFDRQSWSIGAYDTGTKKYTVYGPGGTRQEISRFKLEADQPELLIRKGDEVPVINQMGILERGYRVVGMDQGNAIMLKETSDNIQRLVLDLNKANESLLGVLGAADRTLDRRELASADYAQAFAQEKQVIERRAQVEQMEARQRALDLAREGGEAVTKLRREIEGYERLLTEHKDLERRRIGGVLSSPDEARRRKLAIHVHGNRQTPPLEQLLQEKKQELIDLERKKQG